MLKVYNKEKIQQYVNKRQGETKFGECIETIDTIDNLHKSKAKYVLFGIPEDIGVRANYGKAGTRDAWVQFLKSFLNIQVNRFNEPSNIVLLGHLDVKNLLEEADNVEQSDLQFSQKLDHIITKIDQDVSTIVKHCVACNKIPIIIGGGHNNAFGNIKGLSTALEQPIGVLNIDAHTDLRDTQYRHSGNGFSKAFEQDYVSKYVIFGLHKNYTPEYIFKVMDANAKMRYLCFEDLVETNFNKKFNDQLHWLKDTIFGLELDVDCLAHFPSSAQTPSGFTLDDARRFVLKASQENNCKYIHICEAKTSEVYNVGKALSYLVSDAIRP